MSEPATDHHPPQTSDQQTAADQSASAAVALTIEQVEEQIREAEALHSSLTEKLGRTEQQPPTAKD